MIEVEIADPAWTEADPHAELLCVVAAGAVLKDQAPLSPLDLEVAGVAILLTTDEAVAELNGKFRGKDAPTNVLSFPAALNEEAHLGDIALAFGVCAREAAEQGKPLADHLQHLVAHGVLHLLGYDHETEAEAQAMEDLERRILAGLDVPDPYLLEP